MVYLKNHFKIFHENKKEFKCAFCKKVFLRQSQLKSHFSNVHEGKQGSIIDIPISIEKSVKIQANEQSFKNANVRKPKSVGIVPKLEIKDCNSIVKFELSEEYFSKQN